MPASLAGPLVAFPWSQGGQSGDTASISTAPTSENQCMFCFKSFSNRGSMTRHLRDQHLQPGATVTCDICGKVCKNRNCLITHRSVAHSARRRARQAMPPPPPPPPMSQQQQQQQQHTPPSTNDCSGDPLSIFQLQHAAVAAAAAAAVASHHSEDLM
ncbi:uncharacterized protein LOC143018522 [Oratosquilla oratoria]|uniref:uncharacterized protein LOC143018522 n=1 Tax=Oratosquilla oratoria TaxID=337810 RepID=UPI003F759533